MRNRSNPLHTPRSRTRARAVLLGALALGALTLSACGVPGPGGPYDQGRNDYLVKTANSFASAQGVSVSVAAGSSGCSGHWGTTWSPGGVSPIPIYLCFSGGLATANAQRGTVYMHEVGHAWSIRLRERGTTAIQAPITNEEQMADCFAEYHGANPAFNGYWNFQSCPQSWRDKIRDIEKFAPPGDSTWRVH